MPEFMPWRVSGNKQKLEPQLAGGRPALPGRPKPGRNWRLSPLALVVVVVVLVLVIETLK